MSGKKTDKLDDLESAVKEQDLKESDEVLQEDIEKEGALMDSDIETIVIDDVDILLSFIQESQDHLANIEKKILRLEENNETGVVDDIFRSMHTMKGTSSFLGLVKVRDLSHSLESILDKLRAGKIRISPDLVDMLLEGTDLLNRMVENLSMAVTHLRSSKGKIELSDSGIDISPLLSKIQELNSDSGTSDLELITDEMKESFISEAKDLLNGTEKDLLDLEKRPKDKNLLDDAFRCIHTIKGNAGFLGFGEFENICMEMEAILDLIRNGDRKADPGLVTTLLGTVDSMNRMLDSLLGDEKEELEQEDALQDEEYKPLGEILVKMGETTPEAVEDALDLQEKRIGEILVAEGKVSEEALEKALNTQGKVSPPDKGEFVVSSAERKDIRVDMEKLDKLFDLMGELITAEAMVISNPELEGMDLPGFSRATNYLSKITREMQEITMTVRMIPLEGLFNKMRRLVRDLSRKFGKKINFMVSGQETEMDRNVIEEIADPLVHIIRNAIDHGIEDGKARTGNGKNDVGSVFLNAKYEGNEIWITVKDDGAGLDKERILAKAVERELIEADSETLPDEEIWKLILEPGFSTAEKVSEISGRGVGMDVVKRNIEKLRGKIGINSSPGQGTEIILKIPLTLAILDGITARVGNMLFAFPIGEILEFHKASEDQITKTETNREVLKLREDIIPVIQLYEFFNVKANKERIVDGILIISQSNNRKAGLLVDEIVGYQQIVVKALPRYLGNLKAISGCSIMGNGDVSLILDIGTLLKEVFN
jgi:two-component system chemotaxis sensor kinase CheA